MTYLRLDPVLTPTQALAAATAYGWSVLPHDNGGFFAQRGEYRMIVVFNEDRTFRAAHVQRGRGGTMTLVPEDFVVGRFARHGRPLPPHPDDHGEVVQQLTDEQVADLRRQFRERNEQYAALGPTQDPAAPLPHCPACDAEAVDIDSLAEDPEFGVAEVVLHMRWLPCGHRFRAVVDEGERPASGEEASG
jgi:hypothetical protein